jgi:glutamine cyclotransferase
MPRDQLGASCFSPDILAEFGVPPNRIDLLNRIDGVTFAEAWKSYAVVSIRTPTGEVPLFYLGLAELIRNQAACTRPKDVEDLKFLRQIEQ